MIAGDLLEEYQQGRSRLWYWREVIVAILTGTWSEVKQHSLSLLGAIAMGWILDLAWHSVITPFEYSLIEYVFGRPTSPWQFAFNGFLSEVPLVVTIGWTTARFARRCRIPAVFGMAGSLMVAGAWRVLNTALIAWASPYSFYFSVWLAFLLPIPLLTVLVLYGGGLLTGSPKRSIRT